MVQFLGYAPDLDPATPGLLAGGTFDVTPRGIRTAGGFVFVGSANPGSATRGRPSISGGGAIVYAEETRFIERATPSSAPVVRSAAGLTSPSVFGPTFVAFGASTLAAWSSLDNTLWVQPQAGQNFRAPTTAPTPMVSAIAASASNFGLAFGRSVTSGPEPLDRWWCSALGNIDDWVPSVTTQANTGRLISPGGNITAALALGDRCIVYKLNETWVGSYVGSPEVWRWERLPGDDGCVDRYAVCDIGGAHVVLGASDITIFDGVRHTSIANGAVQLELTRNRTSSVNTPRVDAQISPSLVFDKERQTVYVQFTGTTSGFPVWSYNLPSKRWGIISSMTTTGFLFARANRLSFMQDSGAGAQGIYERSGSETAGDVPITRNIVFSTNIIGSEWQQSMMRNFRWRLPTNGRLSSLTCDAYIRGMNPAGSPSSTVTVSPAVGTDRADFRMTGNWFRMSGIVVPAATATNPAFTHELTHYGVELVSAGKR